MPRLAAGTIETVSSDAARAEHAEPLRRLPAYCVARRHAASAYEVYWVLEGRCVLWVAGHALRLDPRRACIVQPGETHELRPNAQLDRFRVIGWTLAPRGVGIAEGIFDSQRYRVAATFAALDAPTGPLTERLVHELADRQPYHDLLVRAALLELCGRIVRALIETQCREGTSTARELPPSQYVEQVARYVEQQHGTEVTLKHLAAAVGLSPNYLATLFRRYMGRSVMAYVREIRHLHALTLLRTTELSVAEVALRAGHEDPYHFSRVFKAREGCTPAQYRRLARASAGSAPP